MEPLAFSMGLNIVKSPEVQSKLDVYFESCRSDEGTSEAVLHGFASTNHEVNMKSPQNVIEKKMKISIVHTTHLNTDADIKSGE